MGGAASPKFFVDWLVKLWLWFNAVLLVVGLVVVVLAVHCC